MDLASVVAALASVGVRVAGSAPNSSVQVDSSRACPPGLAGPEPSGTFNDLGQHFHPPNPQQPPHHDPHHQPPHWPNPTPYTTPQRYGSTFGDSWTRRCCASTPPGPPSASGRSPWSRRPPWGKASETSSSTPSSTSPDTAAPHAPPQTARARPPQGAESGFPPSTGGDT